MCLMCESTIVNGMTGNQFIDTILIVLAAVFFLGAGAFLPLWELSQNRPVPHRRRSSGHRGAAA